MKLLVIGILLVAPAISLAGESLAVPKMESSSLLVAHKIPASCKTSESKTEKTQKPFYISVWCEGKRAGEFEDLNEDGFVEWMRIENDEKSVVSEDKNKDQKFDSITTTVPNAETEKLKIDVQADEDFDGIFEVKSSHEANVIQNQSGPVCPMVPSSYNVLTSGMFTTDYIAAINTFIHTMCPRETANNLIQAYRNGRQCLSSLNTNRARAYVERINHMIINRGQSMIIHCTNERSEGIAADYTLDRGRHTIRLVPREFQNAKPRKQQDVIFHEVMHAAFQTVHYHRQSGPNLSEIDPVIMCDACCSQNGSPYLALSGPEARSLACDFCSGRKTDIDLYRVFMANAGVGEVQEAFARFKDRPITDDRVRTVLQKRREKQRSQEPNQLENLVSLYSRDQDRGCTMVRVAYPSLRRDYGTPRASRYDSRLLEIERGCRGR